jgi:hypothetical protein
LYRLENAGALTCNCETIRNSTVAPSNVLNNKIDGRFGGESLDAPRRFGVRIFDDKIDMRPFINIVEKRECCGKDKYTDSSDQTKDRDQP